MGHVTLYQGGRKDISQNTNVQEEGNSDKFWCILTYTYQGGGGHIMVYQEERSSRGRDMSFIVYHVLGTCM